MTGLQMKRDMKQLEEWGVVEELEIERTFFIARFRESRIFDEQE
jgi:hypothetical protein